MPGRDRSRDRSRGHGAGVWSPLMLGSGLKLWLREVAIFDGSNKTSQWTDLSGTANHCTQGTGANQAIYTASWRNGRSAILFDNSNDFLANASAVVGLGANTDLSLLVVSEQTVNDDQCLIEMSGNTTANNGFSVFSFGGTRGFRASSGGSVSDAGYAYTATTPVIHSALHTSGTSRAIYENGVLKNNTVAARTTPAIANYQVGLFFGGTLPMAGYIAEVVVLNRVLTATEHTQLLRYAGIRYGITVA